MIYLILFVALFVVVVVVLLFKLLLLCIKLIIYYRLEHLLSDLDLNEILDEKSVSGHVIKHNVCRISKTGVVSLIDKTGKMNLYACYVSISM